ncbi:MAG: Sulfate permease [uncultured Thermomicrobiales bacterium]|uniref:Sulfate permease n=1 Tax=uncultured Thermomicrobiales bacterium TaxID=1645740 RepID=A0A6J4UXX3_9BACT|nr:MAG: Sulfate permease [uncultured Thermomicrobiales bacterium]
MSAIAEQMTTWPIRLRREWLGNIRADLLSGILVALALIPEAIGFSIIAGVDPKVGLYASVCIAIVSAIVGGRPGLISAATGAMAVVMVTLVRDHGLQYLFAATLLTGALQIVAGWLRLGLVMRYIPRSVMIGFVNALALLIFSAQLPQFAGASWQMYAMVAAGLAIIYLFPRLTKAIPSPLVAILVLSALALAVDTDVRTVGDMGDLPTALPVFALPQVPLTLETLRIIFPYAVTLAMVGLIESWLTASLVDDLTDTPSDKNVESRGQGLANIASGLFGGMAGCAMIGQTMINIKSGGRGRLSTFTAGAFLLFLLIVLGDLVGRIPLGALVAVMIMVCIGTFDWNSLRTLHRVPRGEAAVMLATVATVLLTHDLSRGVLVGVLVKAVLFVHKISYLLTVKSDLSADGQQRTYRVSGQMFFASVQSFLEAFSFRESIARVVIDLTGAHVWDGSAVAALDKAVLKFRAQGVAVQVIGLNEASGQIVEKLGTHQRAEMGPGVPVGGAH